MGKLLKILGVALFLFVATVSMAIIAELAKMFPIFGAMSTAVWIFLTSWFLIEVRYGKDKAEAKRKWKEDFCEWKPHDKAKNVLMVHGELHYRHYVSEWKFCPYCGKRIKIAEVE